MKLYNSNFSANAKRVRVCANELGIKLEIAELDLSKGENRTPEYLSKNPMGKVPTFEHDGNVLWESPAILVYLAAKHPEKKLLPTDARDLAETMRWLFWNASHFEASVSIIAYERMIKPMFMKQPTDEARVAVGMADWERFAPVLNGQLEGKTWILGDTFSIADIGIGTTVEFSQAVGVDYSRFPHVKAWIERLQARDAWKRS